MLQHFSKKPLPLFIITIMLVNTIVILPIHSKEEKTVELNQKNDEIILPINDFNTFDINQDHENISSQKTSEKLSFDYQGTNSDFPIYENYALTFEEYGECRNFNFSTTMNYQRKDRSTIFFADIMFGSYLGNTLPTFPGTFQEICRVHVNYVTGFSIMIRDRQRLYLVSDDSNEKLGTNNGSVAIDLSRNKGNLSCSLIDTNDQGVNKLSLAKETDFLINYILINLKVGYLDQYFSLEFTTIYGELELVEPSITTMNNEQGVSNLLYLLIALIPISFVIAYFLYTERREIK
ncbi:MAG: hypothetical protein GF308_10205 [Candidatus Heimdallarchaeota archaeon]|nr:hypothetical protein [Candidatus Heimdallarchaeota archaeon]